MKKNELVELITDVTNIGSSIIGCYLNERFSGFKIDITLKDMFSVRVNPDAIKVHTRLGYELFSFYITSVEYDEIYKFVVDTLSPKIEEKKLNFIKGAYNNFYGKYDETTDVLFNIFSENSAKIIQELKDDNTFEWYKNLVNINVSLNGFDYRISVCENHLKLGVKDIKNDVYRQIDKDERSDIKNIMKECFYECDNILKTSFKNKFDKIFN